MNIGHDTGICIYKRKPGLFHQFEAAITVLTCVSFNLEPMVF